MAGVLRVRPSLLFKGAAAAVLVGLADLFFFEAPIGVTVGAFAAAFALALFAVQPAILGDRRALKFWLAALVVSVVMADRPTFAGWFLFGCLIGMASLSPRAGACDDAWRWFQRLAWQPMVGAFGPILDLLKLSNRKLKRSQFPFLRMIPMLILPALGGVVFLCLFAIANPVIADFLSGFESPRLNIGRIFVWGMVFVVVWAVLRPRFLRNPLATPGVRGDVRMPGVSTASVVLSLIVFNLLFAIQNGLDVAFLYSGARLPEQFTLAEYVHAGVYPLILSALCTGLFVLVALRPGSEIAANPLVRLLLTVWVAQNLFVVVSSAYRMVLYIESYSLTRLRILVLIWMALIALGLAGIAWRTLRDLSSGWLLNLNARAGLLTLFGLAVIDIGAVAAGWNVTHAREVGGRGVELDVCYLERLGDSALVPLAELERRPLPSALAHDVAYVRARAIGEIEHRHRLWQGWTWRAQRRLDRAFALGGAGAWRYPTGGPDNCGYLSEAQAPLAATTITATATPPPAASAPPPSTSLNPAEADAARRAAANTATPSLTPEPQSR